MDLWDSGRLRTASTCWNVPGESGPHGELFFFLLKKEPRVVSDDVPSNPFVSAETVKACALVGLHQLAAEGGAGSSGSQFPDLGDMWRQGCPKSPEWIDSCSASETSLGCEVLEHNNECRAIEVIGQDRWRSFSRIGSSGSFELPHDTGPSLPRNEGCVLG